MYMLESICPSLGSTLWFSIPYQYDLKKNSYAFDIVSVSYKASLL